MLYGYQILQSIRNTTCGSIQGLANVVHCSTYPRCLPAILGDFSRGDRWAGTESPGRIPSMQKGSLQPLESLASSLSASTTIKLSTTIGGQKTFAKLMRNQNCQCCMISPSQETSAAAASCKNHSIFAGGADQGGPKTKHLLAFKYLEFLFCKPLSASSKIASK